MVRLFPAIMILALTLACASALVDDGPPGGLPGPGDGTNTGTTGTGGTTGTSGTSGGTGGTPPLTNETPDRLHPGSIDWGTPVLPLVLRLTGNTALSSNDTIDDYEGFTQNESGPEIPWRFTTGGWALLTATLSGMPAGVDIDIHLCRAAADGSLVLAAGTAGMVVARHNSTLRILLPAGSWYLIADSYMGKAGLFILELSLEDAAGAFREVAIPGLPGAVHDDWDTAGSPLDAIDSYAGHSQDESGPERIHSFIAADDLILTAGLYNLASGTDIDPHLLPAGPFDTLLLDGRTVGGVIARHDTALRADLAPGRYFLIADSYQNKAGAYSLRLEYRAAASHVWESYQDLGRTLGGAEVLPALWTIGRSIDHLSAHRQDDYLSVVCPPAHWNSGMASMSGCALTVAFFWRALGIDEPEIWNAYVTGMAMANLVTIGNRHGCRRTVQSLDEYPGPGDAVDIIDPAVPNSDHVFLITSPVVKSGSTLSFRAVNGGGVTSDGKQLIREIPMSAVWNGTKWAVGAKVISWWVKTDQLPRTRNARLPVDAPLFF